MAASSPTCPKCAGDMQRGFVFGYQDGQLRFPPYWAAGVPQWSFWMGIKRPRGKLIPVGTFRCSSCGFLEEYAREGLRRH